MNFSHIDDALYTLCSKGFFVLSGYCFEYSDDYLSFRIKEYNPQYMWKHYPKEKVKKSMEYARVFGLIKYIS